MVKCVLVLLAALAGLEAQAPPKPARPARDPRPRLVLAIVIDQFRYDYLPRFRAGYTGGLKRLVDQGAVFTNAYYDHASTVTATGHATFLTGATPALSGIIGNEWWDRESARRVTSVTPLASPGIRLVGGSGAGASPERLLQSSLGDELKMSGAGGKVIGVSIKDRSAILPAGRMADAAYWFDSSSGNFLSSTYYFPDGEMPRWVAELNRSRPADRYAGREWMGHNTAVQPGSRLYAELESTPWGNELIQALALAALKAEGLGSDERTDILAVSYSSNDYVGHRYGPDSPETRDMALRVDVLIGDLLRAAEAQAGPSRVLTVLTADHGVAPLPEANARRMPGGRFSAQQARSALEKALAARFGQGKWVADVTEGAVYFDAGALAARGVDRGEMERVAAEALREQPHVFRVYTRTQLMLGAVPDDQIGARVRNGFHQGRSGDVIVVQDPYWLGFPSGTTHGSPFSYDAHVPVIFLGPRVRAGRYDFRVAVSDIAPTLATLLEVETPSGSVGRPLHEILK